MTAQTGKYSGSPEQGQPLRIALVDDHELLLGGLVNALGERPQIGEVIGFQDPAKLIQLGRYLHLLA